MVSMLIATNDWMHDNYIIKSVVAALGWAFGCIAIATYLVSIFKVLPRLALNQHSVFSIDADLPKDHLTANRFIPNINSVHIIYWTYTISTFSYTLIMSILKGYFQGTGEENPFNIVHTLLNIGLGISDILGIVCFIKYGRLIIKLLDESATLIGLVDPTGYTLAAISLDGMNFIMLITFIGIIYGEIREKYSVRAEEITISINYSEVNN
ncbi:7995_t:CDS:2 [Gigaspora rosea]|nr:7995_t:CDS:2 [Gigaspora rosea]